MTVLAADRVLIGGELVDNGWVRLEGDRIVDVGVGPMASAQQLGNVTLSPGLVDIHVHGGGSASFADGVEEAKAAANFHRKDGTTSLLASLASAPLSILEQQIDSLAPLVDSGVLAGVHLEGPFLCHQRRGAHNPALLIDPDVDWIEQAIDKHATRDGSPVVRMITLAPELSNGVAAIEQIVARNVIAALGHSDASYEQAREAIDAGVTVGTHLFNGMPAPHHRRPGPAVALLRDSRVTIELINDGVHVHPGILGGVFEAIGTDRVALVTDAIAATGMPDGEYVLAGSAVVVKDGVAMTAAGDSLAGSTLTMQKSIQNAVANGIQLHVALLAATVNPARAVNLTDRGRIAPGARADLVVFDGALEVTSVMQAGVWVREEEI